MKQIKFRDDEAILGGILTDDNTIICMCCGGTFKEDEVEILEIYDFWMDLSSEIIGDQIVISFTIFFSWKSLHNFFTVYLRPGALSRIKVLNH